ncbi:MAG: aminotransferase class III-fold pyridoxal phosphate-dependent enzyme [candidate division NC10 bacterium]|nr:aminotransferase class III-fold pyridoxal phosphate-dependent enzyme [candidate division NC10 bacterium]
MPTLSERSLAVFPAGSSGEYNLPPDLVTVLVRGEGAAVWDAAGRRFLDFTMGWGSVLLGHAHPAVVEAVRRRAGLGSSFAYVTEPALELAEELVRAVACAERVRFCASGTEATSYAVRLARAYTGRPKVLKFEGAYHGGNDIGTVSLFPSRLLDFPEGEPTSAGLSPGAVADILVAPYNDLGTTRAIVEQHRHVLAAIIVEPLHRCTSPRPGFLQGLRELTEELGLLLIFDETVTGFRLAYGGAQEYYGVRPDLAALGKALGGGYPIGAVVGRADVLDLVREERMGQARYVWFASSLGGNPVSATAALATLAELRRPGTYRRLYGLGEALRSGLRAVLQDEGVTAHVQGDGPLGALVFTDRNVVDYRTAAGADRKRARAFTLGLFRRGIFLNPMSTKLYLSLAHGEADIARFLEVARATLREDCRG